MAFVVKDSCLFSWEEDGHCKWNEFSGCGYQLAGVDSTRVSIGLFCVSISWWTMILMKNIVACEVTSPLMDSTSLS